MQILYIDDSGKVHPNDPAKVAVFAGFSVREDRWHKLIRQISGLKGHFAPKRKPHEWEIKSEYFLTPDKWQRAKNRKFCFELVSILKRNDCRVHAITLEKAKANDQLTEEKFVPIMLQRLVGKFHHQVEGGRDTGSVVLDWSTHQMDHHITQCVISMTVVRQMVNLIGGVSYGSSSALPPLQVADIVASTIRRDAEGQPHVAELAAAFRELRYESVDHVDEYGNTMCSIGKVC
ncbi:MAG: DUF3800 domain-containing protein [Planctomycetia bacterium]|nr:DUF3800 domain-containing protein [Planctomycetia bacterium]